RLSRVVGYDDRQGTAAPHRGERRRVGRRPLHRFPRSAGRATQQSPAAGTLRRPRGSDRLRARLLRRRARGRHERQTPVLRRQTQMFGDKKIALDKDLWERVKRFGALAGHSRDDEFVAHVLEKELAGLKATDSDENIRKKLKGLGYIE